MYLLDTNAWIDCLKNRASPVAKRLATVDPSDVVSCAVVRAELYFGALRSKDPPTRWAEAQAFLAPFRSLPFDDVAADVHSAVRLELTVKGNLIGPHDLLVSAIALANGLVVVTHNTKEFNRVPGLVVEDWQT